MPNVSEEIDIKEGLDDYRSSKDEESSAVTQDEWRMPRQS